MERSALIVEVAAAVGDGVMVDWAAVERTASDEDRRLIAELRFIAEVAPAGSLRSPGETSATTPLGDAARHTDLAAPDRAGPAFTQWGPLRIIERVGRGTFGEVYRAWDDRLDREVALKVLRHKESADEAGASAINEGRLLARVRHPNVITVYGADRIDGQVGVWMEFVRGRTLEQELREHGAFGVEDVVIIGRQLASALAAVHRAGLLHRDVKTHNVMRDGDGRLVLTDLGAGCELQDTADGAPRDLAGTPLYVAPEVLAGRVATPQSDIYSLGVLLYHLATGTYPVRGRSLKEIGQAHERGVRTTLREARPDLPEAFAEIVDRALAPEPSKRYESAEAFGDALASQAGEAVPGVPPSAAGRRVRWWVKAALAAGLVLVAGLGVSGLWPATEPPVIAVVPFKNLGAGADNEAFVDGLTAEIIRNLSVIDGLTVRSHTSSFLFKNKPRNVRDVGEQLNANLLVEGSVLPSNGRLRVNVQLVRVADDTPLWSGRFDRDPMDVFAIQDDISRSVVNELRLNLGRGQRRYDTNLEAYEIYLKARALSDPHGMATASRQSAKLFEQVIARDPAFAPAYAGLVEAWAAMSINAFGPAADEAYAKMRPAADRALELDPLLAEAHSAKGIVLARERDWTGSEAAFGRALELNPNLSSIRVSFAISSLFAQGKVKEAVDQLQEALRADPLPSDVRRMLAWVLVSAGRYDEAIDHARRVLATDPGDLHTSQVLARSLFQKGRTAEAIAILEKLKQGSFQNLGYAYARTGRRAEAESLAVDHQINPSRQLIIFAGLGDKERALDALERMEEARDPRVGMYLTYPELAFLSGDPRVAAVRRKLRLPA